MKIQVPLKSRITGTTLEGQYTFLIISRSFLLRIRNFLDKALEEIKTHVSFPVFFPKTVAFMRSC